MASFLAALAHPAKAEILAIRAIILGADPSISEGVKWNSVSFRTTEWFATVNLRAKSGIEIVMHFGAKLRVDFNPRPAIPGPDGTLKWLGADRAMATFRDINDIDANRPAYESIIREWIQFA